MGVWRIFKEGVIIEKTKKFSFFIIILLVILTVVLCYQSYKLNNQYNKVINKYTDVTENYEKKTDEYVEKIEEHNEKEEEYQRTINILSKDNEYFFKQYQKYFEYSIELENMLGVYNLEE